MSVYARQWCCVQTCILLKRVTAWRVDNMSERQWRCDTSNELCDRENRLYCIRVKRGSGVVQTGIASQLAVL